MSSGVPKRHRRLLALLACEVEFVFGPHAAGALLVALIALSGLTRVPICARTVGRSRMHAELALFVERLLDPLVALRATMISDAGAVCLQDEDVQSLLLEDNLSSRLLPSVLRRLILQRPISIVDAPGGDEHRVRRFDRRLAIILLAADHLDDPELLASLLTLRFRDTGNDAQTRASRYVNALRAKGDRDHGIAGARRVEQLQRAIRLINWRTPVSFDGLDPILAAKVGDCGDGQRLRQALALASVVALLLIGPLNKASHTDEPAPITAPPSVLPFVIRLLDLASVQDDRSVLTHTEQRTLLILQRYLRDRKSSPSTAALQPFERLRAFTLGEILRLEPFRAFAKGTIHGRLVALEWKGFLERLPEKLGRQDLWILTDRGEEYARIRLSQRVQSIFDDGHELQSTPVHSLVDLVDEVAGVRVGHRRTSSETLVPTIKPPSTGESAPPEANVGQSQKGERAC